MINEALEGRSIVMAEHTLGVIMGGRVQILRASILRGSPYDNMSGVIQLNNPWRFATKQDFVEFRVSSKGYEGLE